MNLSPGYDPATWYRDYSGSRGQTGNG